MYCGSGTLVKHGPGVNAAKVLKCRSWQCESCRPERARQLIAMAIKGKAERFITLTCVDETAPDPVERCRVLVRAWREIRLLIAANLSLKLKDRWLHTDAKDYDKVQPLLRAARRDLATMRRHLPEFLAVVEAQKNGNPHLHIMARCPYVPHGWLRSMLIKLTKAEICDIQYVADRRKLGNYVAKYCGKDPHRFGTVKRYWQSMKWRLTPKEEKARRKLDDPVVSRSGISIEEFERAEHCYARKLFWEGKWLHSAYFLDPDAERRPCEVLGCRHAHHA